MLLNILKYILKYLIIHNSLTFKISIILRILDIFILVLLFVFNITQICHHTQDYYSMFCKSSKLTVSQEIFLKPSMTSLSIYETVNYKGQKIFNCKFYSPFLTLSLNDNSLRSEIQIQSLICCNDNLVFYPRSITRSASFYPKNNTELTSTISAKLFAEVSNFTDFHEYINHVNFSYISIFEDSNNIILGYQGKYFVFDNIIYMEDLKTLFYKILNEYMNSILNNTIITSFDCTSCFNNWFYFNGNSIYLMIIGLFSTFSTYLTIKNKFINLILKIYNHNNN